jgi:integrase/recombinase XerD
MSYIFSSNFKPYIEGLIEQKQAIGYPYESPSGILKRFDRFCSNNYPTSTALTAEITMHWAVKRTDEHVNNLFRRITPIRQLAKYMNSIGVEAYVIPSKIPAKQIRYVPHIFTQPELRAFCSEIDKCLPSPFSPAKHLVIPVFFRLLYCCGLRSSEARLLNAGDIDLSTGRMFIRQSKGHKDRTVMLAEDVLALCRKYETKVNRIFPDRQAFFPNSKGEFYNRSIPDYWFHLFWDHLVVAGNYSGNLPRVHDFRHAFSVRRLNLWVMEGKDINAYLPYLSMYLGHVHLTDTDYYMHFASEFFPTFKRKSTLACADLIPEANYAKK